MGRNIGKRDAALIAAAVAATIVCAPGCAMFGGGEGRASTVALSSSAQSAASEGQVKTKITSDRNTKVTVTVKHLAPPERSAQGATTYVVWVRPLGVPAARAERPAEYSERQASSGRDENGVFNLGGLKISEDRDGELQTVTPFHSFELFITAEPSSAVTAPNGERVLWATVAAP